MVLDSRGRTRLMTQESGDEFALVLKGPGGQEQVKIATDDSGSNVRVVVGKHVVDIKANAKGGAGLEIGSEGVSLRIGVSGDAGGLSVMDKAGQSIVGLGGSASESSLVLRNPVTPSDIVTVTSAAGGIGRGLIVSSASTAQAGTVVTAEGGMTWVGDWSPKSQGRGPGFYAIRDIEHGVALSIRDKKDSPGILLHGGADSATMQIRSRNSGDVVLAAKDSFGAAIVIKDPVGKEMVRLPAR